MFKQMLLLNEKTAIQEQLDAHTCDGGPEDSCDCYKMWNRLGDIKYELKLLRIELSKSI